MRPFNKRTVSLAFRCAILCLLALLGPTVSDLNPLGAQTVAPESAQRIERTYDSLFNPKQQGPVSTETNDVRISLKKNEPCERRPIMGCFVFEVMNKRKGTRSEFVLENEIAQVDEIHAISTSKVAVIGRVMSDVSMVTLVDVRTGKVMDSFYCFFPAVSENKQLVAYVKIFPRHFTEGVSAQYLIYDFRRTPEENRPSRVPLDDRYDVGVPVFPPGSANRPGDNIGLPETETHMWGSRGFFWSKGSQKVAFADSAHGKITLVVADISSGVKAAKVWTKDLPINEIVDLACCQGTEEGCRRLENAFHVAHITFEGEGNTRVKLQIVPWRCLKRHTLDVQMH